MEACEVQGGHSSCVVLTHDTYKRYTKWNHEDEWTNKPKKASDRPGIYSIETNLTLTNKSNL